MKILTASLMALSLMGATAANADIGAGVHVGGAHVGAHVGVGVHDHDRYDRRHAPRCDSWGWRNHHHQRYCRHWSR